LGDGVADDWSIQQVGATDGDAGGEDDRAGEDDTKAGRHGGVNRGERPIASSERV
jgi:hypothetical protein